MGKDPYLSVADAISAFLKKYGLQDEADVQMVINEWAHIMGQPIATNTEKIWYEKGILFIRMSTPIWKNELQMARGKIRDTVNRKIGRGLIKEVKLV